jgi:hypothetical protein
MGWSWPWAVLPNAGTENGSILRSQHRVPPFETAKGGAPSVVFGYSRINNCTTITAERSVLHVFHVR